MRFLPQPLRSLAPGRLRDDVRVRALAVGLGLVPPRTMHSDADLSVLTAPLPSAQRVVEIGVYEGASALALCRALAATAELHLIDPFGHHVDALPAGWGATEWATRRVVRRAVAGGGPRVVWHIARSHEVAERWNDPVDVVFIDGDHSAEACALDWDAWSPFVVPGGHVVFHDARLDQPGGRGLPGPTDVVNERFRGPQTLPGWEIVAEADRTVAVRRAG
jgi:predicted O-methyltransferase YrrM